jgi:hypothetical protein
MAGGGELESFLFPGPSSRYPVPLGFIEGSHSATISAEMKDANWSGLTPQQQHALLLAMNVRSAMEEFHGDNLTDLQMM